jgi:hypothetical protein
MEKILWKIDRGSSILDIDKSFGASIHKHRDAYYMIISTLHYFENWEFNKEGDDEIGHYYQIGFKLNQTKTPCFYINVYLPEGFTLNINKGGKDIVINFFEKDFIQDLKSKEKDCSMFVDLESDSREQTKNV